MQIVFIFFNLFLNVIFLLREPLDGFIVVVFASCFIFLVALSIFVKYLPCNSLGFAISVFNNGNYLFEFKK